MRVLEALLADEIARGSIALRSPALPLFESMKEYEDKMEKQPFHR